MTDILMTEILKDGQGQSYIQWKIADGNFRRVWVRRPKNSAKDYAKTGRYLSVVRTDSIDSKRIGGNPTDFPVYSEVSDDQILRTFIRCIIAMTGQAPAD